MTSFYVLFSQSQEDSGGDGVTLLRCSLKFRSCSVSFLLSAMGNKMCLLHFVRQTDFKMYIYMCTRLLKRDIIWEYNLLLPVSNLQDPHNFLAFIVVVL